MANIGGGFVLHNPDNGKYVQFDGNTIIFDSIEEVAEFKNRYRAFFSCTQSLPQIVAVDDEFISCGACVGYKDIDKSLLDEAEKEVNEQYAD